MADRYKVIAVVLRVGDKYGDKPEGAVCTLSDVRTPADGRLLLEELSAYISEDYDDDEDDGVNDLSGEEYEDDSDIDGG